MNSQEDRLSRLYGELNRGHDRMREQLLSDLETRSESGEVKPASRVGVMRGSATWSRWYAGSALGLAAAALAAVVWIAWPSPSLTLAQVRSAVTEQKWVLIRYGDGEESWICLMDGRRFFKTPDGRVGLNAPGLSEVYVPPNPNDGAFPRGRISVHRATPEQRQSIPAWRPISAWDYLVAPAEDAALGRDPGSDARSRTARDEVVVDGRRMVRFDSYVVDALGERRLAWQLWADPETRLPVRTRKSRRAAGGRPESFVEGTITFPGSGPKDIYSLGARRDAQVVPRYDPGQDPEVLNRPPDLRRLLSEARTSIDRFPDRFRLVKWHAEATGFSGGEIDVLYWDGKPAVEGEPDSPAPDWKGVRLRQERYFNLSAEYPAHHLPLPADAQQVLDWVEGQTPVSLGVSDGERTYSQSGPYPPPVQGGQPSVQVIRIRGNGILMDQNCWAWSMYWPFIPTIGARLAGHHELVAASLPGQPGTVWMRITRGARRFDYHIAPERDHICLRQTWWRQLDGGWHKEREYNLSDLRQTAKGRWWAAKVDLELFDDPERGTSGYRTVFLVDVTALEPSDFPDAAFDGARLLEDARAVNADIVAQ